MNEQQHFELNNGCLDRGLLVSMRDGELSAAENERALAHLSGCADCSADERDIRNGGQDIYTLLDSLNPSGSAQPDSAQAFAALHAKICEEQEPSYNLHIVPLAGQKIAGSLPASWRRRRIRWITAVAAAVLIAVLLLPNAGVLADQFLALFRVQQFQPVKIDANQTTQSLYDNLTNFGSLEASQTQFKDISHPTKSQIEHYTHFHLALPTTLPHGLSDTPTYHIFEGAHATFTFDAARARATMQKMGDGNVHIPAQLNGASYKIIVAPGVGIQYTQQCKDDASADCSNQQQLVVAEIPSPTVQGSSANSLNDLRAYMLSLAHLPPDFHNLWQNVDLSTGTIPLPLPTAQTNAQRVSIHGADGILLVDTTIKYGGVLWQSHDIVYAIVTNSSDRGQILHIAQSLK
jgi:hypothetical protein